ncbi:MAG: hypothetical protein PHF42_05260 [Pseudomonas sp.]|nr:hypothetical protein [Pseudomonas sp.]
MTDTATTEPTQAAADMAELKEVAELALSVQTNGNPVAAAAVAVVTAQSTPTAPAADGEAAPAADTSPESRARRQRERARRQREAGSKELKREYVGTMTVPKSLTINDPNVASSALRFLALTDRTLYLLKTMGIRMMNQDQCETLHETLTSKIEEYCEESKKALNAATALIGDSRQAEFDWIIPVYSVPALDETFQTKDRHLFPLIEAINAWDSTIAIINELEFNGKASFKQVDEVRSKERRLFSDISYFCYQVVMGLMRKSESQAATPAAAPAVA